MNRLDPSHAGAVPRQADVVLERLGALTDLWVAGAPPTSQQLRVVAEDVVVLRAMIAPAADPAPVGDPAPAAPDRLADPADRERTLEALEDLRVQLDRTQRTIDAYMDSIADGSSAGRGGSGPRR